MNAHALALELGTVCKNCRYWIDYSCRRHAPAGMIQKVSEIPDRFDCLTMWPRTHGTHTCGDFDGADLREKDELARFLEWPTIYDL